FARLERAGIAAARRQPPAGAAASRPSQHRLVGYTAAGRTLVASATPVRTPGPTRGCSRRRNRRDTCVGRNDMLPKLLFATEQGTVLEHPYLRALVRSGDDILLPEERPIPLPAAGRLVHLPGRRPVGYDPETGSVEVVDSIEVDGKRIRPHAAGAMLPRGY